MGELYVPLCACIGMLRGDVLLSKKNKFVDKQKRINNYILKLVKSAYIYCITMPRKYHAVCFSPRWQ